MYLTRNYQEKTVMARVMRECKMHSEYFPLKDHGSWEKAESAARKWIRDLLPTLPAKLSSKNRMTSRNKSGVVGVHRSRGIVKKKNGRVYECPRWVARWPDCKLKGGLSWSVIQFDEDGAFVLAVLARRAESVNRESLLGDFSSIVGKKEFEKIAALRHV